MSSPSFIYVPAPDAYYRLSPVAKLTWIGLCSFASWDDGRLSSCFPGMEGVAARTGLSRSTIKRGFRELVRTGFIIRRERLKGKLQLTSECLPGPALNGGPGRGGSLGPGRGAREAPGGVPEAPGGVPEAREGGLSDPRPIPETNIKNQNQGEEEEAAAAALSRILELWNRTLTPLGFPRVAVCTAGRRKALKARMRESAERRDMAWWEALMSRIAGTPFLVRGVKEGARWFSLDWLLREENLVKLLEGRYEGENRLHGPRAGSEDVHSLDVEGFVRKMMRDPFWGGEEDDGEGTPTPPGLS